MAPNRKPQELYQIYHFQPSSPPPIPVIMVHLGYQTNICVILTNDNSPDGDCSTVAADSSYPNADKHQVGSRITEPVPKVSTFDRGIYCIIRSSFCFDGRDGHRNPRRWPNFNVTQACTSTTLRPHSTTFKLIFLTSAWCAIRINDIDTAQQDDKAILNNATRSITWWVGAVSQFKWWPTLHGVNFVNERIWGWTQTKYLVCLITEPKIASAACSQLSHGSALLCSGSSGGAFSIINNSE